MKKTCTCSSDPVLNVQFKKLSDSAVLPFRAHASDAGMDLTAASLEIKTDDSGNKKYVYGLGFAAKIPKGHVGLIFPRSSIMKTSLRLSNAVGVIDSGYLGEWKTVFDFQLGMPDNTYKVGDRIAQLIIIPYPEIKTEWVDELEETDRGHGGFGSSGR